MAEFGHGNYVDADEVGLENNSAKLCKGLAHTSML